MKSLLKSFFIYGISSSLGKFIGLFLVPIYTRIFNPTEYGIIDLIQTITAILAIFGMLLLESSIQRFYYEVKDEKERKQYIATTFWTISCVSSFLVILVSVFSKQISFVLFSDTKYYIPIIIAAFKIPIANLFVLATVIIRYMKKPLIYSIFVLIQMLVTIGTSVWLVVYLRIGIIGVFYGQLAGFSIVLALMIYYLRSFFAFYWKKNILLRLLNFSLPQLPGRIGVMGNNYANRFIILGYLTLSDIGLYTIALQISSVFLLLQSAFTMAWYPFLYEQLQKEGHRALFAKITSYTISIVFVLVVAFALISKELLILITTEQYYGSARLIGILALSQGLLIISNTTNLGALITKKTIYTTYSYVFSMIINISTLFILVPSFGLIGVPLSILLGNVFLLGINWVISEKLYFIGFKKLSFLIQFSIAFTIVFIISFVDINVFYRLAFLLSIIFLVYIYIRKQIKSLPSFKF